MTQQTLTSAIFLSAAYAAIDTIYLKGNAGRIVDDRDLHKAEGKAEQVFDDHVRIDNAEARNEANVAFTPDYDEEKLHIVISCSGFSMNCDLYLGDYGVNLVETPRDVDDVG